MELELTVTKFRTVPSSFAESSIDLLIESNAVNNSEFQLEHIIDFLVEVYGRDEVKKYMRRTYDCEN